ncbi:MAG: RNase P subunit p30 family protein [archaeon]
MQDTIFINEKTFEKARKEIRKNKGREIIFSSNDDELNRKILEKEKINVLLLNHKGRRDRQKQRESGLNHVLAKIAKKNNIAIGVNFDEIFEARGKAKADILARISQNIKLCNKARIPMKFIAQKKENYRDINDLKALGLVLGMPTWMTKEI